MTHGHQVNRTTASKMNRSLVERKIVIHQLIFIAAFVLIPLLTWHIATLKFFEDYRMQDDKERITKTQMLVGIEDLMTKKQLSRSKTALWAVVWILTSCDILYALWYLGRCQSRLHLEMGKEVSADAFDDRTSQTGKQQPERNGLRVYFLHSNIWTYTRRFRHVALQLLPLSYDISMVLFPTLHVYNSLSLIDPSLAICDADEADRFPISELPKISFVNSSHHVKLSLRERCERYVFNFTVASGFSSAVAALLAALHLASLLCRFIDMAHVLKARMEHTENGHTVNPVHVEEAQWHVQPRDIDIHARGQAPSESPGRLTVISEEEQSIGGGLTRRRRVDHSRSGESGVSRIDFGAQGRREEGFLECLVP